MRLVCPLLWIIGLMSVSCSNAVADHDQNPLLQWLITEGVLLGDGTRAQLPPPMLEDSADKQQQESIIERAAGKISVAEFTRNSWTARFPMSIVLLKNEQKNRLGQRIDVAFLAYGSLAIIEDHDLLDELVKLSRKKSGDEDAGQTKVIESNQLAERGIEELTGDESLSESFHFFEGPILDKVLLSGVARSIVSRTENSILVALAFDERFTGDKDFPNQWRPRTRDSRGQPVAGDPSPYSGFGGYVKVTELSVPEQAMLVEIHFVFDEPVGWFQGRNLLRSKIPLLIKENAQTFRKKLKEVSE